MKTTFEDFQREVEDWMNIECEIDWNPIEWKITIENDDIYICQNNEDWVECNDKKWYKYSYIVQSFNFHHLSNIKIGTEEELTEWTRVINNKGEWIIDKKLENGKVLLRTDDNNYVVSNLKNCEEVKEETIKEYTMEEIQEKLWEEFKLIK